MKIELESDKKGEKRKKSDSARESDKSGPRDEEATFGNQDGVCSGPHDTEGQETQSIEGRLPGPQK